jgi:hypothetical protein
MSFQQWMVIHFAIPVPRVANEPSRSAQANRRDPRRQISRRRRRIGDPQAADHTRCTYVDKGQPDRRRSNERVLRAPNKRSLTDQRQDRRTARDG